MENQRHEAGEFVLVRYVRGPYLAEVRPARVVQASERHLLLWVAAGTPVMRSKAVDGRSGHQIPLAERDTLRFRMVRDTWRGPGVLMLLQPGAMYSVWWFFKPGGGFSHWYVNLESAAVGWRDGQVAGLDAEDHTLDLVCGPDRRWRWKDEAEFAARIGHQLYWSAAEADQIRANGCRIVEQLDARAFPFDGAWCGFQPDPSWQTPDLPAGWDRPTCHATSRIV